jgi:hypothetical protein
MSVRNPSDEIDGRITMLRLIADQAMAPQPLSQNSAISTFAE